MTTTTTTGLMNDLPLNERPRERLAADGANALKNSELLAILLRTGRKGASAVRIAEELLTKYGGSLQSLASATLTDLRTVKGIGRDKAVTLIAAFALARKMAQELWRESPLLDTPEAVAQLMREEMRLQDKENLHVLLLNTRRRLIKAVRIAHGTLDTLLVHPREVFQAAIAENAAAIVLLHNHPSGDPTPSEGDIKVTRDLIRAGQVLKIDVLDHVIFGRRTQDRQKDYTSLRELGYFY